MLAELLGKGRDDGRVESATEQYTVGDVGHQLSLYGIGKGIVDGSHRSGIILDGLVVEPVALVITF